MHFYSLQSVHCAAQTNPLTDVQERQLKKRSLTDVLFSPRCRCIGHFIENPQSCSLRIGNLSQSALDCPNETIEFHVQKLLSNYDFLLNWFRIDFQTDYIYNS